MQLAVRLENALEAAVSLAELDPAPPTLKAALRHAVFPGGARVRPQLCLAVAEACGGDAPGLADAAAAAVELLHCASLVHDDLPCFDDAPTRRGRPSVHAQFGVPLAVLTGDALIVMAFETLARAGGEAPQRLAPLIAIIAKGVAMPAGIVAGQAWESEPHTPVEAYHQAKTGALFAASTMAGAVASGADPAPWRAVGDYLGAAYQVADDIMDATFTASQCDKPIGRDAELHRPSIVSELGIQGAYARLEAQVRLAVEAIPECNGDKAFRDLVRMQATRLASQRPARTAA